MRALSNAAQPSGLSAKGNFNESGSLGNALFLVGLVAVKYLASRKFLLCVATVASATWLVAAGHIADGVYSAVVISAVGGYLAANVTQKATTKES